MAKCSGYACGSLLALSALPPRRRLRVRSSCARMPGSTPSGSGSATHGASCSLACRASAQSRASVSSGTAIAAHELLLLLPIVAILSRRLFALKSMMDGESGRVLRCDDG